MAKREPRFEDGLTPQKRLFCKAFILTGELANSVRIAYPDVKHECIDVKANRLKKDPHVVAYLKILEEKTQGTMEDAVKKGKKILDELELVGFQDPRNIFPKDSEEGKFLAQVGDAARTIASIEITTDHIGEVQIRKTTRFKFHDKLKALELRGKNLQLYTDIVKHEGEIVSPQIYRLPDNGMREKA